VLRDASRYTDEDQTPGGSPKHAMAIPGTSPEDAIAATQSFIQRQIKAARFAACRGARESALFLLGQALHAIMDSSSPAHTDASGNEIEWDPTHHPLRAAQHSPFDLPFLSPGLETAGAISPAIFESQRARMLAAYDDVFGGESQ
jgi:hypothetical protein